VTQPDRDSYDFEVALSFAGEDREYVEDINEALKQQGIRTFLDTDYLADLWGEDLVEFFDDIYRKRSLFAMLFISCHYGEKMWPRHERRSALVRALKERSYGRVPRHSSHRDRWAGTSSVGEARRAVELAGWLAR